MIEGIVIAVPSTNQKAYFERKSPDARVVESAFATSRKNRRIKNVDYDRELKLLTDLVIHTQANMVLMGNIYDSVSASPFAEAIQIVKQVPECVVMIMVVRVTPKDAPYIDIIFVTTEATNAVAVKFKHGISLSPYEHFWEQLLTQSATPSEIAGAAHIAQRARLSFNAGLVDPQKPRSVYLKESFGAGTIDHIFFPESGNVQTFLYLEQEGLAVDITADQLTCHDERRLKGPEVFVESFLEYLITILEITT